MWWYLFINERQVSCCVLWASTERPTWRAFRARLVKSCLVGSISARYLHMNLLRRYVNKQHAQIFSLRCNGIIDLHVQDKQQVLCIYLDVIAYLLDILFSNQFHYFWMCLTFNNSARQLHCCCWMIVYYFVVYFNYIIVKIILPTLLDISKKYYKFVFFAETNYFVSQHNRMTRVNGRRPLLWQKRPVCVTIATMPKSYGSPWIKSNSVGRLKNPLLHSARYKITYQPK